MEYKNPIFKRFIQRMKIMQLKRYWIDYENHHQNEGWGRKELDKGVFICKWIPSSVTYDVLWKHFFCVNVKGNNCIS